MDSPCRLSRAEKCAVKICVVENLSFSKVEAGFRNQQNQLQNTTRNDCKLNFKKININY